MGNKVDYDDDLEMTKMRLEDLNLLIMIKSNKSDGAVIEDASLKDSTLDILKDRVDDDGKTEESDDSFKQKMNVNSRKKGLMEWVKDCKEFDEEKTILIGMMVQAVQVGIQLSNLIVDFVFMMSWQEDLAAKIGEFKSEASNWVIENRNNSMVIDRIVTLLAMADNEVSQLKKSKREVMIKNKGWTATALDQGSRVGELLNLFVEQVGKILLDQLIEISLRLEAIMIVGESSVLALEYDLNKCEEDVETIREDISALKITFPLKLGIKDSKMIRTRDTVASNIYELWNGLLTDSSDEDQIRDRATA